MVTLLLTTPATGCQFGVPKVEVLFSVSPVAESGQEMVNDPAETAMLNAGWAGAIVGGTTSGIPVPDGAPRAIIAASLSFPTRTCKLSTYTVAS